MPLETKGVAPGGAAFRRQERGAGAPRGPRVESHRWSRNVSGLDLVEDEGAGLSNPANFFVPFFTTKKTGSGIGLVLAAKSPRPMEVPSRSKTERTETAAAPGCDCRSSSGFVIRMIPMRRRAIRLAPPREGRTKNGGPLGTAVARD